MNSCLKYLLNIKRIKTILKLFYLKKNSLKYLNRKNKSVNQKKEKIGFEIPNEFKNAFQVQNLQGQKASVYFQNQAIFQVLF